MPLTDEERQRIYEEEAARREMGPQYTPIDWLAACIIAPFIIVPVALVVIFLAGLLISKIGGGH